LWISYNLLEKLDGLSACKKLRVLYMSNNKLANFAELNKLKDNPALVDLMLLGNPMYATLPDEAKRREEVIKNCPPVANNETFKLDGILVTPLERGSALGLPPA
jgi:dynein light chain 1